MAFIALQLLPFVGWAAFKLPRVHVRQGQQTIWMMMRQHKRFTTLRWWWQGWVAQSGIGSSVVDIFVDLTVVAIQCCAIQKQNWLQIEASPNFSKTTHCAHPTRFFFFFFLHNTEMKRWADLCSVRYGHNRTRWVTGQISTNNNWLLVWEILISKKKIPKRIGPVTFLHTKNGPHHHQGVYVKRGHRSNFSYACWIFSASDEGGMILWHQYPVASRLSLSLACSLCKARLGQH